MDTLEHLLEQFATDLQREEVSDLTVKNYLADLRGFSAWFEKTNGEPVSLKGITPTDVRGYKTHLVKEEQRKPATVNHKLAAIKRFIAWARGKGLLDADPTEGIKSVEKVRTAPKGLSKNDLYALNRAVEKQGSKRDQAILALLRHTGLRVGEVVNLKLSDVHATERKGHLIVREGKGAKWREIPLNADVRKALKDYLEVRPRVADDHLFIGKRKGGMTVAGVQDVVEKYARLAELEDVTPHTLRHTFAKNLLDQGVDLVTVASLLGHSRLDTTAIYTKPSKVDQERAVEKIADTEA